jgi:hypothetical protein
MNGCCELGHADVVMLPTCTADGAKLNLSGENSSPDYGSLWT